MKIPVTSGADFIGSHITEHFSSEDDLTLTNGIQMRFAVIVPSIWPENCSLVALEAFACGIPLIVADKGGLPEIADRTKTYTTIKKTLGFISIVFL